MSAFLLLLVLVNPVYASETSVELSLPVKQNFDVQNEGAASADLTGVYALSANEDDTPLPEGSQEGTYTFTMQGAETQTTIPFSYTRTGVYRYTLRQVTEDAKQYHYDRTSYTITVYIENDSADGLIAQVVVENEGEAKCGEIAFQNSYQANKEPKPPKPVAPPQTGDTSNVIFWILLAAASLMGIGIVSYLSKNKK